MEEKLEKLYGHINDLLKFAEAKNAGLLAFNGIVLMEGFKNLYEHENDIPLWLEYIIAYVIMMNFFSFLICLSSLFPSRQTRIKKHSKKNPTNLLYFGTIATFSPTIYFDQFQETYNIRSANKSFCIDLIRQLIIRSQILVNKFNKFRTAFLFTFCGFTTPVGYFIYNLWIVPSDEN